MDHPGLGRFMAQAAIGYIVANFALIVARILLVPAHSNDWFVFWLVAVFVVSLGVGSAAGLIIFLRAVTLRHSPNAIYRSVIGMVVVAALWFYLALSLDWEPRTPVQQLWALAVIIVPGIGIAAVTNSGFRLWHELV